MLSKVVLVFHVLFCLGLVATVLLQSGRSAGLSGAIAGGAETLFGKKKGLDDLLSRISTGFAVAFMVTSLILTVWHG
ncbi:MAG TPA: preprotein translocase subunit SecG [Firmicutes bacterium]|nr:preprotein translocase subunit SecG [Bacillota bacterium]